MRKTKKEEKTLIDLKETKDTMTTHWIQYEPWFNLDWGGGVGRVKSLKKKIGGSWGKLKYELCISWLLLNFTFLTYGKLYCGYVRLSLLSDAGWSIWGDMS